MKVIPSPAGAGDALVLSLTLSDVLLMAGVQCSDYTVASVAHPVTASGRSLGVAIRLIRPS